MNDRDRRDLVEVQKLATEIENGDFYFGRLESKCQLIRAIIDRILDK